MLAYGAGVAACGEIAGWYRLARHRKDATAPDAFPFAADVPACAFHKEALCHLGIDTIVDSSKSLEWALEVNRWYQGSDIEVYNVLIWKSPVDHAYSFWKRGLRQSLSPWYYGWPFYHQRLIRSGAAFVTVRYDELISDPQRKLRRLCDYVGIPYFPGKEEFWNDDSTLLGSSPGVKRQIERGNSTLSMEPLHSDFEPVRARVSKFAEKDNRVRYVMSYLSRNEIDNVPSGVPLRGHRYDPSAVATAEQAFWRMAKNLLLRLRWNTLHSFFGPTLSRLYLRYFTPDIKRTSGGFDPGDKQEAP